MIDFATVRRVAELARLELSDADLERLAKELGAITMYIDKLAEVDVSGVDLHPDVEQSVNMWREDEPGVSLPQEVFLRNAPAREAGYLRLPQIVE